ncbi:MAG: DUF3048 domain-containing protein [Oscillospiraceae bacterium]|nr:DUF3048 domain-containing protein [Oscillospiraceae bacterium]
MKKWITLLLAAALLLAMTACGSSGAEEESVQTQVSETVQEAAQSETKTETEPETETAEETQTVADENQIYTNPLTGEVTDTDISANRPIAVMLNLLKISLPQSGNGSADMLIEATEEGGITRIMALYQDISGVGNLGTIRSTREYFTLLAMGFDALMVHAGGSSYALNLLSDTGYESINFLTIGDSLYWRDSYRLNNVGTEHSMYTSSDLIEGYLETTTKRTSHESDFVSPYTFTEDGTPDGDSATDVTVSFSSYKDTEFVYDEATGTYAVYFFGGDPYIDENTGEQVTVTNIVILPTLQYTRDDDGRQAYDLTGGTGYFACGGKYIEINWEKGDMYDPLVLTNTDGSQLDLGVGKTYICLVGDTRPITFE